MYDTTDMIPRIEHFLGWMHSVMMTGDSFISRVRTITKIARRMDDTTRIAKLMGFRASWKTTNKTNTQSDFVRSPDQGILYLQAAEDQLDSLHFRT
jgi:hypothetical protein